MKSTRLGRRSVGPRLALGASSIVGIMTMLILFSLGGTALFMEQAGASDDSNAMHGLAGAPSAPVEVPGFKVQAQSQSLQPETLCGALSFAPAVNYPTGTNPYAMA